MFVYLKYLIIRNYFFILNHLIQSQVFLFIIIIQNPFSLFHLTLSYNYVFSQFPQSLNITMLKYILNAKNHVRILVLR